MSSTIEAEPEVRTSKRGEPTWEIADFFPLQGYWSEREYLRLNTNKLVEFNNGILEVLPVPTYNHQLLLMFLLRQLQDFLGAEGHVVCAVYKLKISGAKYREPDIMAALKTHENYFGSDFATGADLAIEIVSPGGEARDYVEKKVDYAAAQIPEYWIVDPPSETIFVFKLQDGAYAEHGRFTNGQALLSPLLPALTLNVSAVFSAGSK